MGWEFRRSLRFGPFRVTLSKRGISYSAGVRDARITKRADGKVQRTFSIPGTGLSYRTTSGKRSRRRR